MTIRTHVFKRSGFLTAALAVAALNLTALILPTVPAMAQVKRQGADSDGPPILRGVAVRAPHESSVIGRQLRLNGDAGHLEFQQQDADFVISKLVLGGKKISARGEACEIEVEGAPFVLRPLRRVQGLRRFEGSLAACPFTLEIHNGAVQVNVGYFTESSPEGGYCEFKAADCRGNVAGFWGPADESLSRTDIVQSDRIRGAAEKNAQANYRALMASFGKDRPLARMTAFEQAGFSSRRTERCEDYAGEARHGFCASRITEAWAIALRARQNPAAFEAEETDGVRRPGRGRAAQSDAHVDAGSGERVLTRLPTKHRALARKAPVVAGDRARRAKSPVTRHHEGNRIASDRRPDGARSLWTAY